MSLIDVLRRIAFDLASRLRTVASDVFARGRSLLSALTHRTEDRELTEEIRFHIERQTEKNLAAGMSPEEARRRAHIQFGGAERMRERTRQARGVSYVESLVGDLAHAIRTHRRRPGLPVTVILTLGLGIGASVAAYQLFDAVSLQTLPVDDPESLVVVEMTDDARWQGRRTSPFPVLSNSIWEQIRDRSGPFAGALAWADADFRLGPADELAIARGIFTSGSYFRVLGVGPAVGRVFAPGDDRDGCGLPGAVLSHGFWQRRYGGDPAVVGRTILLESRAVPILGVAESGFRGLEVGREFDVAVPVCAHATLGAEDGWLTNGRIRWLTVMGRVSRQLEATGPTGSRRGILDAANAGLASVSPSIFESTLPADYPAAETATYLAYTLRASAGAAGVSSVRDRYGDALAILVALTVSVLLIACTNLANLFLARGSARRREFAVRRALGSSRARLVGQLTAESLTLAVAGGAVGVAVAGVMARSLVGLIGTDLALDLRVDAGFVGFVAVLACVSCLVFGLIPGLEGTRPGTGGARLADDLREARGSGAASRGGGLRRALVVTQVAFSFVLLFGALLFAGTLRNLMAVDTGFRTDDVAVVHVDFSTSDLDTEARAPFKRELLERVRGVPGVTSAAEVRHVPLGGTGSGVTVVPEGVGAEASVASVAVRINGVTPGFLDAMGVPLLAGRMFEDSDPAEAALAVVNPTFARVTGLGADPVGRRFRIEESELVFEVVGLVPDTRYFDLREEPLPIAFVPKPLFPDPRSYTDFVVRSATSAAVLRPALSRGLAGLGSGLRIEARPFGDMIADGIQRERLMAALSGFFGILAALVAAVGLYGVLSHLVVRRTPEIGTRLALGASRGEILRMVLRSGGALVVVGLGVGAGLSLVAGRAVGSLVFGLDPHGPGVLAGTSLLFFAAAFAACFLPARRAAGMAPTVALKGE